MNRKDKRHGNIRNKLLAAIAMLLVSSIMMVSTTYAWFTLSTAPEVQGITTTVGANGNLEIALMPYDGDVTSISTAVGDANKGWYNTYDGDTLVVGKNYTWGNLLDVSEGYSLDEITLLPARLAITKAAQAGKNATLNTSPLEIATYGADGRIDDLVGGKVQYGAKDNAKEPPVAGFLLQDAQHNRYGVRVLGTSSTQSETALNFQNNLSGITSNKTSAQNTLSASFATYGDALASIALKHAQAGDGTDNNNYATDVPAIKAMVAELSKADAAVEEALYNALLALANTEMVHAKEVEQGRTAGTLYTQIKDAKAINTPLESLWGVMGTSADTLGAMFPKLTESYSKWQTVSAQIATTQTAADALPTTGTVTYTQLSATLSGLMNVSNITINGRPVSEAKSNIKNIINQGGLVLELNAGSGVFATFAELTGTIGNTIALPENMEFGGMPVGGVRVNITTTTTPAAGALLDQTRTQIAICEVAGDTNTASVIDVSYGYALDFVFRTNAANSSLMLQTDAAQRVYGDSQNAATMGHGSTMSFNGTFDNLNSLASMMSGIRVVFTDTKDGSDVYGIAKVLINAADVALVANTVNVSVESTDSTDLVVQLTAVEDAYGNVTLQWTNQGVAGSVTTTTGTNDTTKKTYTEFTIQAVKQNADTGVYELDTANTAVEVYRVYDQDVTLEGELSLMNYDISDANVLTFGGVKSSQALKLLSQNVPTAVTALVYLDGDYIDNSDVTNSENGISTTGKLNLQFASSANLVPMTNSSLKNGVGVELPELPEGWTIQAEEMTDKNADYDFVIGKPADFTGTYTVTYKVGEQGQVKTAAEVTDGTGTYKIPSAEVTDNIQIMVNIAEPTPTESQTQETQAPSENP